MGLVATGQVAPRLFYYSERGATGMSRQFDEGRRGAKKPKNPKANTYGPYVSFHPDKGEKEALSSDPTSLEDVLYELMAWCEKGHQLTLKWVEQRETFQAALRQGAVDWKEALTVSAHHSDPEKALRALRYALRSKWPEFPLVGAAQTEMSDDW